MTIHPSLTEAKIVRAAKANMFGDSFIGFCTACGRKAKHPCEDDLTGATCQFKDCGKPAVYGAGQLLLLTVA